MKRFVVRCAGLATSLLLISATPVSAVVITPGVTRWQFAPDLRSHPNVNPFSSLGGGPAVWSLRASRSRTRTGDYPLLSAYSPKFGSAGLKAWHGSTPGCVQLPAIGVNTLAKSVPLCSGRVPGKAAFARPTATRMAVIAWTSPFDGSVNISHDAIADVDPACGDGITYYVDRGTTPLSITTLANKDAKTLANQTVVMHLGQSLNFIVDPGPNNNAACDITQLQITIDRVVP